MLVSLAQASAHLRRDTAADDADLTLKVYAASAAVMNYIQGPGIDGFTDSAGDVFVDSNGEPVDVPYDVQAATLLLIGYFYKNRDDNPDGAFERGYLPAPVCALLTPYRDPSVA